MKRPGSIARLMAAIAVLGLLLTLLRSWLGPENRTGELGPMAIVALLGLAGATLSGGRARRFGLGMAATGLVAAVAFLLGPTSFRDRVFLDAVFPIMARMGYPPLPGSGYTAEELRALWLELGERVNVLKLLDRGPFWTVRSQVCLGLMELPIALAGGMLASARPRGAKGLAGRRTPSHPAPSPPDRP